MLGPLGANHRKPSWSIHHCLGRTPHPPRLICPGRWELPPPVVPRRAPTTICARLPAPPGWCARLLETATPRRPSLSTDHRLGRTPCPPRLVCSGLGSCYPPQALLEHRPPPGQDSPSPQAGVPRPLSTASPRRPSLSTDHHLDRTPRPPGLVCPGCWKLLLRAGPP